jgi:hypothetical protein
MRFFRTTIARFRGVQSCVVQEGEDSQPREVVENALDHLCNPPRSMVGGTGKHLHVGRIHSPAAGRSRGSADSSIDLGKTAGSLTPFLIRRTYGAAY